MNLARLIIKLHDEHYLKVFDMVDGVRLGFFVKQGLKDGALAVQPAEAAGNHGRL